MTSIRENEALGCSIEKIVADEIERETGEKPVFPANKRGIYDFEVKSALYEVKSCHVKIRDGFYKRKQRQEYRNGRFWIFNQTHESLREAAENSGKQALYVFVLLDGNHQINNKKTLTWQTVHKIISTIKPRTHGDYGINHKLIFEA